MVVIGLTILLVFDYLIIFSVNPSASITANINSISLLNGTNFKYWKENVMIVLGCMDLDLTLRTEQPPNFESDSSTEDKKVYKKWERSNRPSQPFQRLLGVQCPKRQLSESFSMTLRNDLPRMKGRKLVHYWQI